MKLPLPKLEARLQARFERVLKEHLSPAQILAAGLRALPKAGKAFSSTQGLWRFLNNEKVTLPSLGEPLLTCGQQLLKEHCTDWGLVPHDWSKVRYTTHTSKTDQVSLGKGTGYTLEAALLLSDRDGAPLSPLCLHWWTAQGCYTTSVPERIPVLSYLDAITATMKHLRTQKWGLPLCHIIDRAADSAAHLRAWDADGETFLVRGDEGHKVEWEGRSQRLSVIAEALALRATHAVEWDAGIVATLFVGETTVRLTRPAYEKTVQGRRVVPGAPLTLRLIVCEVRLPDDTLVARWCLLSNAPPRVSASTLIDWYYWRWRIEICQTQPIKIAWCPLRLFRRVRNRLRGEFKRENEMDVHVFSRDDDFFDQTLSYSLSFFKRKSCQVVAQQAAKGFGIPDDRLPMHRLLARLREGAHFLLDLLPFGRQFLSPRLQLREVDGIALVSIQ